MRLIIIGSALQILLVRLVSDLSLLRGVLPEKVDVAMLAPAIHTFYLFSLQFSN
jgi:hypothetical protein